MWGRDRGHWAAAAAVVLMLAAAAPGTGAEVRPAATPRVEQLVVFRSGKAIAKRVSTAGLSVRVGRRRCAVPSRTPLAAFVRSRPGRIRLRDFGSCSRRARDASGLYVHGVDRDQEAGRGGWVYKVGRKAGTAGAADPTGPFGRGRLRAGQRVLWFYCLRAGDCQRTLSLRARAGAGGLAVTVTGYDDAGKGRAVAGATVHAGAAAAITGGDGTARLTLPAGRYAVYAEKDGLVRSFDETAVVP
jgi:hypothetical protein